MVLLAGHHPRACAALAPPPAADAQTTAKAARVGLLGDGPVPPALYEIFKQSLDSTGHQFVLTQHDAGGVPTRLPAIAAQLVRSRPDVIFARGPIALAAAAQGTKTTP